MNTYHIALFYLYAVFLVGMVAGAVLARSPLLWLALIVLTTIAIALMGYFATRKPRKKKLPARRNVRIVR